MLNERGKMKRKIFGLFFIMFFSLYPDIPACGGQITGVVCMMVTPACIPTTRRCRILDYKVREDQLSESEMPVVKEITEILNNFLRENAKIKIVGHTDNKESIRRKRLSRARALEIYNLMKEYGLREDIEVEIIGAGSLEAISDNSIESGRYFNRRVEILFDTEYIKKNLWELM